MWAPELERQHEKLIEAVNGCVMVWRQTRRLLEASVASSVSSRFREGPCLKSQADGLVTDTTTQARQPWDPHKPAGHQPDAPITFLWRRNWPMRTARQPGRLRAAMGTRGPSSATWRRERMDCSDCPMTSTGPSCCVCAQSHTRGVKSKRHTVENDPGVY